MAVLVASLRVIVDYFTLGTAGFQNLPKQYYKSVCLLSHDYRKASYIVCRMPAPLLLSKLDRCFPMSAYRAYAEHNVPVRAIKYCARTYCDEYPMYH